MIELRFEPFSLGCYGPFLTIFFFRFSGLPASSTLRVSWPRCVRRWPAVTRVGPSTASSARTWWPGSPRKTFTIRRRREFTFTVIEIQVLVLNPTMATLKNLTSIYTNEDHSLNDKFHFFENHKRASKIIVDHLVKCTPDVSCSSLEARLA